MLMWPYQEVRPAYHRFSHTPELTPRAKVCIGATMLAVLEEHYSLAPSLFHLPICYLGEHQCASTKNKCIMYT